MATSLEQFKENAKKLVTNKASDTASKTANSTMASATKKTTTPTKSATPTKTTTTTKPTTTSTTKTTSASQNYRDTVSKSTASYNNVVSQQRQAQNEKAKAQVNKATTAVNNFFKKKEEDFKKNTKDVVKNDVSKTANKANGTSMAEVSKKDKSTAYSQSYNSVLQRGKDSLNKIIDEQRQEQYKKGAKQVNEAVGAIDEFADKQIENSQYGQIARDRQDRYEQREVEKLRNSEKENTILGFGTTKVQREQAEQDIINNVGGYFKDGVELSAEEREKVNNSVAVLNDVAGKLEQLSADFDAGKISELDFVTNYNQLYEDYTRIYNDVSSYEVKTGWDYYDAIKDSGSDNARELTALLSHYNDNILERIGKGLSASIRDYANTPMQAMAVAFNNIDGDLANNNFNKIKYKYKK